MNPFTYQAPTSIEAAIALLSEYGPRARPLAGGTDLLVQLRRGAFDAALLVDVKHIPELTRIAYDSVSGLTFGAAVSCAELCEHPDVRVHYPGLVDAVRIIGGAAIQNRATVGGNLCNAAPSGDSLPALIVLGAEAELTGADSTRCVPVRDFCTAPGRTVRQPNEMLVALRVPAPTSRSGAAYLRFIPRAEMDIAVAGAGAWLQLAADGTIADARIALAAVAPTPLFVAEAGAALIGQRPTEDAFAQAAAIAQKACRPITDVRGTADQRRHLVGVLVKRALRVASGRVAS